MSNRYSYNGFFLANYCAGKNGPISLRMEAYDANKLELIQSAPVIPSYRTRFVSTDHVGNTDFIYMLIFFDTEEFSAPPGMNIIQGVHGGGGGAGVTILGTGGSVGASATVTSAYSQPSTAIQMQLVTHQHPRLPDTRTASWRLESRQGDKSKKEDGYVFTATELSYLSFMGKLLGN